MSSDEERRLLAPVAKILSERVGIPARIVPGFGLVIRADWGEALRAWLELLLRQAQPTEVLVSEKEAANVTRIAQILAVFGEDAREAWAAGQCGVFLKMSAAEEVAGRLEFLCEVEARGYL